MKPSVSKIRREEQREVKQSLKKYVKKTHKKLVPLEYQI